MSGPRVGSYEIVRMLARGGMAVVYLVRQPALDREVVLKRLDLERDDPTLAQRFVREARLAAALDHPNVVTLFDFFEDDGVPYIAMEYVAGGSLRSLVGTLELPQVLGVLEGTLAGLAHAERHEIAHRDLKPENILLTRRGNVKIADFGIARAYNALSQRLTLTGKTMGTPIYMAPEQALDGAIGPPTDLYALGVIVYELLAGRPPFESDTPMGVLYCHVHKPPPRLPHSVQPRVREWVEWLLEKSPDDRPQSAGEAWHALEEIAVAELGPYWRRAAAITTPTEGHDEVAEDGRLTSTEEATARQAEPTQPQPQPSPPSRPRSARLRNVILAAAAVGVVAISIVGLITSLPKKVRTPAPAAKPRVLAAVPFDFDATGRMELVASVLGAGVRGSRKRTGVVLVRRLHGWKAITETDARMPGRPGAADEFGLGMSSGDFDRDGKADLAIGAPGRSRVSVLFGTGHALTGGRRVQLKGPHRFGGTVLANDLNGDDYADLIVSAPGAGAEHGTVQLLLGGPDGLTARRMRTLVRPASATVAFGSRMQTGDIDGDRRIDLVEGAPAQGANPGHMSWCRGSRSGPRRCRAFGATGGTAGLAVADVNRDGYEDIAQGDPSAAVLGVPGAGVVRLWLGSRHGPRPTPITIAQSSPAIPGEDEPHDGFGAVVEAGDVDSDGFPDLVVAAPGENLGAGRVTVIRGNRRGYATAGNSSFDQDSPNVPGRRQPGGAFGSTLRVFDLTGDRRPDLVVGARGEHQVNARLMVVRSGPGVFAPDETRTTILSPAVPGVHLPARSRIRLARIPHD